jgi:hypothetical protein
MQADDAAAAGRTVFNIPHLKVKIFYEFKGLQHPLASRLGAPRHASALAHGSAFSSVDLAAALLEHSKWTVEVPYSALGLPYECAHRSCWDPAFPRGVCDLAQLQARTRADLSDVLLQMAWRYGCDVRDWEDSLHGLAFQGLGHRNYEDTCYGRRRCPRAWDSCGIGLSVSMPKARLLDAAARECPPDEQPDPSLTGPEIVRHILEH